MLKKKEIWPRVTALGLGFLALGVQIIFMRSLLEIHRGNELIIGLILAVWLTGTASGSLLFFRIEHHPRWQHFPVAAALPIILFDYIFILFSAKIFGFLPLVPQSFLKTLLIIVLAVWPAATLCGALFPYFSRQYAIFSTNHHSAPITTIYIWESLGSVIAALMMNFLLFHWLLNLSILLIFLLLFYSILFLNTMIQNSPPIFKIGFAIYLILIALLLVNTSDLYTFIYSRTLAPYHLEAEKDTPYGNIKIIELEEQRILLQQGLPTFTWPDPASVEFHLLPPLLCHPHPESILLIGGHLSEYLPYLQKISSLKEIIYLQKDYFLLQFQQRRMRELDLNPRLSITYLSEDPRNYLSRTKQVFSVICLNEAEPYTLYQNRYYTREFYQMIFHHLEPQGIYYFTLKSSENYLNPPLGKYLNLQMNTLLQVFPYHFIIPGDDNHFLLSRIEYQINWNDWSAKLDNYGIVPIYLTPIYGQYRTSPERIQNYQQQLVKYHHAEVNEDFNLKGYFYHFQVWGGLGDKNLLTVYNFLYKHRYPILFISLMMLIIIKAALRKYLISRILFNLGFVGGYALFIEIAILLWYQIIFGDLYSAMALLFGLFMLGLAVGARGALSTRLQKISFRQLYSAFFFLLLIIIICANIYHHQHELSRQLTFLYQWIFIPFFIFSIGILSGFFFAHTTQKYYHRKLESSAGITYGIDLVGGVIASAVTSIFVVPYFGLTGMAGLAFVLIGIFYLFERKM